MNDYDLIEINNLLNSMYLIEVDGSNCDGQLHAIAASELNKLKFTQSMISKCEIKIWMNSLLF